MSEKPANPRAFPLPVSDNNLGYEGMTLRDYFAAAALQGMCANPSLREDLFLASMSFEIADAMLRARDEGENHE